GLRSRSCMLELSLCDENERHPSHDGSCSEAVLAGFEFRRRDEIEPLHGQSRASERIVDCGADVRRGSTFATADASDDHGLPLPRWLGGSVGPLAPLPPPGSTRQIAIRRSPPPIVAWRRKSRASVSVVTAFTTNRPPTRSARVAGSRTILAPPPMNIASA